MDVGNLSGSSAFLKSSLNIWKFSVHVLLKPGLEKFEHYFASVWNEYSCVVIWTFFDSAFLWDWIETDLFQYCGHCWVFQICWHIECNTLTASSFRIWNCSIGIPSLETPGHSSMQSFIIPPVVYKGSTLPHPLQHLLFIDFLLLRFFYFIFFQCYSSILFRR